MWVSVLFTLSLIFFILTFSIGLPIYFRPFYYAHIGALDLSGTSGYSVEQIKTAYNAVLDYLTLPGREFSVGELSYSADGAAHFADCKFLFDLNGAVLLITAVLLALLLILRRRGKIGELRLGGRHAAFWAGTLTLVLVAVLGFLASLDFDRAFVVFHTVFFPGKDNWIFDSRVDPIIDLLPQVFFRNCAILIGCGILLLSLVCIIYGLKKSKAK